MTQKNKIKLNFFDFLILGLVLMFLSLAAVSFYWPQPKLSGKAVLGVRITEENQTIKDKIRIGEAIFLNGSNNPSQIKSLQEEDNSIIVFITGPAAKNNEVYNFNGQRVLIGQRAELHGSFFARGVITSFDYE